MVVELIKHQFRSSVRSIEFGKNLTAKFFIVLLFLLMAINLFFVGTFFNKFIEEFFPNRSAIDILNSYLIYFFAYDLIVRNIFQKVPGIFIKPYLHLPIKRRFLIHYVLMKSLGSLLNFLPLFMLIPFTVIFLSGTHSLVSSFSWLVGVYFVSLTNSFLTVFLNKKESVSLKSQFIFGFVVLIAILLDVGKVVEFNVVSFYFFNLFLQNPIFVLIPTISLFTFYYLSFATIEKNIYNEYNKANESSSIFHKVDFKTFSKLGVIGNLLSLELKLILRNKRIRNTMMTIPLMIIIGIVFYSDYSHSGDLSRGFLVYMGAIFVGILMFSYGAMMFAWESGYLETLLTKNLKMETYLKTKQLVLINLCIISYLLFLPLSYFGVEIFYINSALFIYSLGVTSYLIIFLSTFNKKRVFLDLSIMSTQGKGAVQYIMGIILLIPPLLIYLALSYLTSFEFAIFSLAVIGISGLIMNQVIIKFLLNIFYSQKYKMIKGFRENV